VIPAETTVMSAAADDRFTFDSLKEFIDIIKIALLVFGGVAILVGAFTIFNALSITVAQRSRELGLLRLVGASRKQVLGSVVVEALALGVLASIIGVAAGYGLAKGLTELLASMGLDLPEAGTVFAGRTIAVALAVGIVVTTLAGLIPAFRATRVAPVAVLREADAKTPGPFGRVVRAVVGVLGRPAERIGGTAGGLARRNAMRNPGRIMSTASALTIGVALVTLVTVVASGLKDTATSSLERRVSADHVIVSSDGWSPVDRTIVGEVAATPGVKAVSGIVQDGGKAFGDVEIVNGVDPATLPKVFKFDWKDGTDAVPGSLGATGAIVDSGWASEHALKVGSTFAIQSAKGTTLDLTVRGIEKSPVLDALGLGPVTIGKPAYDQAFANQRPVLTMVSSSPSAGPALKQVLAAHPDAELDTTSAWIKDRAAGVDQLVAIFGALLALAVIVSLFGIVNTLVLSTFERTRELGMLRAVGMTRRQMRRMVRHESIITALLGALTGMAIGLGLAAIVTSVFADSGLAFVVPTGTLIAFTIVAIVAGVLAAVFPARRAAKLSPLAALAYE
jgi:putative ABC transport system permease protein